MIKSFFNKFINPITRRVLHNNTVWKVLQSLLFPATYINHHRKQAFVYEENKRMQLLAELLLADLTVKNGPFKGLKYPGFKSIWSTIYPKLIGSYEYELKLIWDSVLATPYTEILDIGCAEGYYAVGMALRQPTARVFAYDIDNKALAACAQMADLNKAGSQITLVKGCTIHTLSNFPFTRRGLIISDCENYEYELFSKPEVAKNLVNTDIIIELHDYSKNELITANFKDTHEITFIQSLDDNQKAKSYDFPELQKLTFTERKYVLEERRVFIQEWLFLCAKN